MFAFLKETFKRLHSKVWGDFRHLSHLVGRNVDAERVLSMSITRHTLLSIVLYPSLLRIRQSKERDIERHSNTLKVRWISLRISTQNWSVEFTPGRLRDGHPLRKRISPQVRLQRLWKRAQSTPTVQVGGQWEGTGLAVRKTGYQPPSTRNLLRDLMPVPSLCQPSISPSQPSEGWGRPVDLDLGSCTSKDWFGHFQGAFLVVIIDREDTPGIWLQGSVQHMGRPCPVQNLTAPDSILECPTRHLHENSLLCVSHINTKNFCMILTDTGFSRNETTRQIREGLYFVLFRPPLFQKITALKAMLFMYLSGQCHTFISVSVKQASDRDYESSLVISSHSHINIHIILL